ncbi:MAG: hypothetical protein MJ252_15680, partial [archaeon]|nr:hypothetical protein [archaeon]
EENKEAPNEENKEENKELPKEENKEVPKEEVKEPIKEELKENDPMRIPMKDYEYFACIVKAPSGCAKPKGLKWLNENPGNLHECDDRVFIP